MLSVALSLGSLPAGITRRLVAVEPGLSSPSPGGESDRPAVWPKAEMGWNDTRVNRSGRDARSARLQAQERHQPRAGLTVRDAVHPVGSPVALESLHDGAGVSVEDA